MVQGKCCQTSLGLSTSSIGCGKEHKFAYVLQDIAISVNTITSRGLCDCQYLALLCTST